MNSELAQSYTVAANTNIQRKKEHIAMYNSDNQYPFNLMITFIKCTTICNMNKLKLIYEQCDYSGDVYWAREKGGLN